MRNDAQTAFLDDCLDRAEPQSDRPRIAILMCTKDGARFLDEQLASLHRQSYAEWRLYVSDDGSQDETLEILQARQREWGPDRLSILSGPQRGFVANFLSLVCNPDIRADYFAWCDQDDIWHAEKLSTASTWLREVSEETPALYCGRTELISEVGDSIGHSMLFSHPPHFSNALVQNIAGGNTMVFNSAARTLLQEAGGDVDAPSHDWWAYQLISGVGGIIKYDPCALVFYRQHQHNIIGSNAGWIARFKRLGMIFQGSYQRWSEQNIRALDAMQYRLASEHRVTLEAFKKARSGALLARIWHYRRSGIFCQTFFGKLGLIAAIILRKI
ncbi:hypothetical protein L682_16175 [Aquipseudomonas alcaligenes OT 69]|nr:hypothetical protein L682_16175 [Pseudomonas alcaligenes OT 69]